MKKEIVHRWIRRIWIGAMALMIPVLATSCTTTYDAYGNPRQSIDPGTAAVGVVAAGLIGYALSSDNDDNHHRGHGYRGGGGYYGSGGGHGGGGYYDSGGGYGRGFDGYGGGYDRSCAY